MPSSPSSSSKAYEPHPNPTSLTATTDSNPPEVNYAPNPSASIPLPAPRQHILDAVCRLYSGSASEADMQVYAPDAIYDDPWSYCDTRYKIAGQWYGIPKIMAESRTLATEVVESSDRNVVFKLRQEYRPQLMPKGKQVDSLVSLALKEVDGVEKVVYHKDMWNEKDYSHEGLGKVMKTLNGDHLTGITKPPEDL